MKGILCAKTTLFLLFLTQKASLFRAYYGNIAKFFGVRRLFFKITDVVIGFCGFLLYSSFITVERIR